MPLNDLSLDDLRKFSDLLLALNDAGDQLRGNDLEARFDLTPGEEVRISVGFTVPGIPIPSIDEGMCETLDEALARFDQNDQELYADHEMTKQRLRDLEQCVADLALPTAADVRGIMAPTPSPEAAPDAPGEVVQPEPAPEPEETPPAVEGQAGGSYSHDPEDDIDERAFSSAAPSRPEGVIPTPAGAVADSGGGGEVAAAPEAPAAQAAAGTHQRGFQAGPSWTAEEDERLIAILVNLVRLGETKKAAIAIAARDLGRPEAGTAFRCHHKVKARIDAALTAAAMHQAQTEPAAEPAPQWTEEEDAILIDTLAFYALDGGTSRAAAILEAVLKLPRWTERQVRTRLDTVLKDRLAAEIAARQASETPSPDRSPEAASAGDDGDAAVGGHSHEPAPAPEPGAAVQDSTDAVDLDARSREAAIAHGNGPEDAPPPDLQGLDLRLWQYLRRNRPRWPMNIGTDLDLVEALGRGDKLSMIAADIGIDAVKLKDRFQVLTAMILDAKDRPTIDGQQRLMKLLRRIVADAPSKAA